MEELFEKDGEFKKFIEKIVAWDKVESMRESYPYGLAQYLQESSINPKKYALMTLDYLYKKGSLSELIEENKDLFVAENYTE